MSDWLEDESMTPEETMRRFKALNPHLARGPYNDEEDEADFDATMAYGTPVEIEPGRRPTMVLQMVFVYVAEKGSVWAYSPDSPGFTAVSNDLPSTAMLYRERARQVAQEHGFGTEYVVEDWWEGGDRISSYSAPIWNGLATMTANFPFTVTA